MIWIVWNAMLRLFLRIYIGLQLKNVPHFPHKKCILVSNHTSHFDAFCLAAAIPLTKISLTYAAAAKDCFFKTKWKAFLTRCVINAISFDRTRASSIAHFAKNFTEGDILIFFPEGTRSLDGHIQPFKNGIGALTAGEDILVIPARIDGAHRAWPKGRLLPLPFTVKVTFGTPLSFKHIPKTKEGYSKVARELEQIIKGLDEKNYIQNH